MSIVPRVWVDAADGDRGVVCVRCREATIGRRGAWGHGGRIPAAPGSVRWSGRPGGADARGRGAGLVSGWACGGGTPSGWRREAVGGVGEGAGDMGCGYVGWVGVGVTFGLVVGGVR
jgi:hypothetical protein